MRSIWAVACILLFIALPLTPAAAIHEPGHPLEVEAVREQCEEGALQQVCAKICDFSFLFEDVVGTVLRCADLDVRPCHWLVEMVFGVKCITEVI